MTLKSLWRLLPFFYNGLKVRIAFKGVEKSVSAVAGVPVMIREIYTTYHLPMKPAELKLSELKFWYEPLIPELLKMQKANKNRKAKK